VSAKDRYATSDDRRRRSEDAERWSLVFTGQLDTTATTLTLVTNEKGGGDNQYSTRPKIVVDAEER
jgi:hypothetical protein